MVAAAAVPDPVVAVSVVLAGTEELVAALTAAPDEALLLVWSVRPHVLTLWTHPEAVDAHVAVCGRVVTPAPAQILSAYAIVSAMSPSVWFR